MARRTRGASQQSAATERTTQPDGLFFVSPTGLCVLLAWPALLWRRKTAAAIAATFTPWRSQKFVTNVTFSNFFTDSKSVALVIQKPGYVMQ